MHYFAVFCNPHPRCDKNGDGQIDYHEFALHLSRQQQPPGSQARPRHTPSFTSTTRLGFRDPTTQKYDTIIYKN